MTLEQQKADLDGYLACVCGEANTVREVWARSRPFRDLHLFFNPKPEPAHYFDEPSDLLFDTRAGDIEIDWNHVVIDSVELNDRHNFQATFFYRIVAGKPFYFAKVYGQVRVCWSNAIAEQKYDEILYAPRASPQLSPQHYENAAAFYARRGQQWFYVLAGFPGK